MNGRVDMCDEIEDERFKELLQERKAFRREVRVSGGRLIQLMQIKGSRVGLLEQDNCLRAKHELHRRDDSPLLITTEQIWQFDLLPMVVMIRCTRDVWPC